MALRLRDTFTAATIALALAVCGAVLGATGAEARGGACVKYGDTQPAQLKKGQARKAILCLLNEERAAKGLPAFDRSKKLQRASQKHSARMTGSGCFEHQCPGEGDLVARLETTNYLLGGLVRWICAENIAWGTTTVGTPRAIMDAWMNSAGHRANILNAGLRDVGVGFAKGSPANADAPAGTYTTDFGSRAK